MSIESVRARMSELAVRQSEIMKKPETVFQSILEEKLGAPAASVPQNTSGTAADNAAELYLSGLGLQNTLPPLLSPESGIESQAAGFENQAFQTSGVSNDIFGQAAPYMSYIEEASARYHLPANLIMGVIKAESDFNTNSVSYAGAKGLMQLMPANCEEDGVTDPFDPAQNINAGSKEIAQFLDKYDGDLRLALAAYNTGPGNIAKRQVTSSQSPAYQTVPQIVRDYVERVLRYAGYQP